jgi:hypothetical protein
VNVSNARELLRLAATEEVRLQRHLLVAAALREILAVEPIVVGGTAEGYYTVDEYHETDLDLCGWTSSKEEALLVDLGFERRGRHWVHLASKVPVEFPEDRIDGDEGRTRREPVGPGNVLIIGVDDLYLDRIRQATADPRARSISFHSALAIGAATFDVIDWVYVDRRIQATLDADPPLGALMRELDQKVRRTIRRAL